MRDADAKKVRFNIETKVEDGKSGGEGMVALTKAVVAEIYRPPAWPDRTTVQSFDWSSLNLTKKIAPELPLVALSSGDAWLEVGKPGASPNLGGIDIDTYGGSLAKAAAAQGYDVISPAFRSVTPAMIAEAHELGLPVIPWTVNTTADMDAADGPRRGRHHHRLPHPPAHSHGRARPEAAQGVLDQGLIH